MNEQHARRIQKLMKINMKAETPPEPIARLVTDSISLDNRITGKSDKEVIDILISKEEQDSRSIGVMYHILTSIDNPEIFQKMIKFINGAGVEYWHYVLCNINMIFFECWPVIHLQCKEQLIRLIREAVRQNVKQIENVLMNAYRVASVSADLMGKQKIFMMLTRIIRENEGWFKAQRQCAALVSIIITSTTAVIASSPAPMTAQDTFRESLTDLVHWVIKNKKTDCITLGRDFILVLFRLGKTPQGEDIWKDLATNPASYGVAGIEDFMIKPNLIQHLRISIELDRKLQFMVTSGGKNTLIYFSWLTNKFFRGPDGPSLRAECVRFMLYMNLDPAKYPPSVFETRIQIIHLLLTTVSAVHEQQFLKLCLFLDWFGCDERNLINYNYVEVPFAVIRYALFLTPGPPHPNSIVQSSHCSHYANSLLEYLCKSVDTLIPVLSDYFRKNLNNAMKCCRDRLQHGFSQVLENSKIDRKTTEQLRAVFPDFIRNGGVALPVARLKKKPVEEIKQAVPSTSASQSGSSEKIEKPTEKPSEKPAPIDSQRASSSRQSTSDVEKLQKKEKAEKEEKDLNTSLKLLRGEVGAKMVALKTQWHSLDDDADKCEAVEAVLQLMLNTEENFDDAQQELAAQCLQGIMGCVVEDEKSLLPDNEKDLSEAFTHPIYSVLKFLCNPPNDDDCSTDMMATMLAAMREKDSSLTYVLLYFIKGTSGSRSRDTIDCYKDIAKMSGRRVDEMLASDLQLCAINDIRLFANLVPFVFSHFEEEVMTTPDLLSTLCSNLDAIQLRSFVSEIIREEIKLFRKESFTKIVMGSVEWATTPQWVFWHLIHADGVPIEWFLSTIPKLDFKNHHEAIANILLMMKRMDREPWAGLIRALFARVPHKGDTFTVDALKVLIEDSDQCQKVSELVAQLIKKLIGNNDLVGVGVRATKKGNPTKLTLQQVLEHLQHFSTSCVEKKQRSTESFMSRNPLQEAFASIRVNEKASMLVRMYSNLFGAMEIIAQETKEHSSSRTLRGNSSSRQGSTGDKQQSQQQSKRKTGDTDDEQNNKKRKVHKEVIELSDSDSD
uniref:SOSS complex subunit A homolog n=1 Tax=Caenorhabditis tropicalis TaxID=1561998 RepID=A0A1I7T7S3_9PELO